MSQSTPDDEPVPMVEPIPSAESPEPRRGKRGVIVRVLVWGAVVVAVVLAYLELRARYDYAGTVEAWYDAQARASEADDDFRRSQLDGLVRGTPRVAIDDTPRSFANLARQRGRYTWHGVLRDYTAWVDFGLPADDPDVLEINDTDPGEEQ